MINTAPRAEPRAVLNTAAHLFVTPAAAIVTPTRARGGLDRPEPHFGLGWASMAGPTQIRGFAAVATSDALVWV